MKQMLNSSERKAKLAQKLAEFRQRSQLKESQQLLISLGISLDACKIFLPNTDICNRLEQWLSQSLPWQCGQIDWQKVSGSICESWGDQVISAFHSLCQTQQLGNPIVNIVWFLAAHPILEMPLELVKLSLEEIVAEDWDTWIFDPVAGRCIEFHHKGTMCYGKL
ncbi:CDI toxin immunity protein [Pseudanabaena sp. UWO311]|uniref:CDI toxin immunity protein n=2 Tax=Pseudanabaena sp. UWO311 TaxID=2487337 RepID=UPI0030D98E1B